MNPWENLMADLERLETWNNDEFEAALDELRSVLFRIMTWQNIHEIFGDDDIDNFPET